VTKACLWGKMNELHGHYTNINPLAPELNGQFDVQETGI
jgi:hypothetical protein